SLVSSLLQLNVPNDKRGRVMSFYQMSFGISGLSALPVAALATVIGAPDAIAICGVLTAVAGVAIFVFRPALMLL
ncbi:MAG TPA: MFS transporter, partial [Chloroflexota bacterium]|nr:MFS transporter [Chloroflexota bacterium]